MLTMLKSLVKICADKCTGDWDDSVDTMPCADIEAPDALASSPGHDTDERERTSLENIIANIPGHSFHASASQASGRLARQKRRAIVADVTAERHVKHVDAESAAAPRTYNLHEAGAKSVSQLTPNSLLEHSSSLFKRDGGDGGDRPKWQPTVCTAPGVTCGNGGDGGNVPKVDVRAEAESHDETLPSRLAVRASQPLSKLPNWWPLLCTTFGVTCAQSGSTDGDSTGNDTEPPSVSEAKREAQPRKIPPWQPTSCTSPGITCGESGTGSESQSASEAKRETQPAPLPLNRLEARRKIPPWQPTSCTAPGITCGDNGDNAEPPSVADAKREAQPLQVSKDQLEARRKIPPWQPTSCTAPGITCGDNGNDTAADLQNASDEAGEASSTNSQAGVKKVVERDPETAAAVQFGGTNGDTFTDDDSNVVDIKDV